MTHARAATVIIPAAGIGSRLSLPFPKELVPIGPGKVAIDATFDLLRHLGDRVNVVVAVSETKLSLVSYLQRYGNDLDMAFVRQRSQNAEMTGAIRSCLPFVHERCVVLLPDQLVTPNPRLPNPVERMIDALDSSEATFLAVKMSDPDRLRVDGALTLRTTGASRIVTRYVEKPKEPGRELNAIWAALGFRRSIAERALDYMENGARSADDLAAFRQSPFHLAPAFLAASCIDIGTWPAYSATVGARS